MNYKFEESIQKIKNLMKENGGYVTSKMVKEQKIHLMYLKKMLDEKMIERISRGIYIDVNAIEDVYYTLQLRYPKVVFSRFTALYFYGLTEIYPSTFDLTVPANYHVEELNRKHSVVKCRDDLFSIGLINIYTSLGHKVNVYDMERCICDIIKYRHKLDLEQVKKSVKMYVASDDKNLSHLSSYSKQMGIYKDVMEFVGMHYE